MVKVTLLKPLDGMPIGAEAEFNEQDAAQLEAMHAVKRAEEPKNKKLPAPKNKAAQ